MIVQYQPYIFLIYYENKHTQQLKYVTSYGTDIILHTFKLAWSVPKFKFIYKKDKKSIKYHETTSRPSPAKSLSKLIILISPSSQKNKKELFPRRARLNRALINFQRQDVRAQAAERARRDVLRACAIERSSQRSSRRRLLAASAAAVQHTEHQQQQPFDSRVQCGKALITRLINAPPVKSAPPPRV